MKTKMAITPEKRG